MTETKQPKHSYSSTGTYATCQEQYHQINWLRVPEYQSTDNEQNIRGSEMHDEVERCILEDDDYRLPDPLHPHEDYNWMLEDFRSLTGLKIPEMQLAINKAWRPCDYKDPHAFYRGKVDLTCINGTHMNVQDLKTGKRKFEETKEYTAWLPARWTGVAPDMKDYGWLQKKRKLEGLPELKAEDMVMGYSRQASEYALMMFCHFPQVETIDFSFIWSNIAGVTTDDFQFQRERDIERMMETMLYLPAQIANSIETDTWTRTKSGLCNGHCSVVGCVNWKPKKAW